MNDAFLIHIWNDCLDLASKTSITIENNSTESFYAHGNTDRESAAPRYSICTKSVYELRGWLTGIAQAQGLVV